MLYCAWTITSLFLLSHTFYSFSRIRAGSLAVGVSLTPPSQLKFSSTLSGVEGNIYFLSSQQVFHRGSVQHSAYAITGKRLDQLGLADVVRGPMMNGFCD